MNKIIPILLSLSLFAPSGYAIDNCAGEQMYCETECSLRYFSDEAAEMGCKSKCLAQRAVCSTEAGAKDALETGEELVDKSVEASKEAWEDTKSFIKGITE